MIPPNPLNMKTLKDHWIGFNREKPALERIIHECAKRAEKQFGERYEVSERTKLLDAGLFLKIRRGRLKKPMKDEQVWIWAGIYPLEEDDVYVAIGLGWNRHKRGCQPSSSRFSAKLEERNFAGYVDNGYDEFYREDLLRKILSRAKSFDDQERAVSGWLMKGLHDVERIFSSIYGLP